MYRTLIVVPLVLFALGALFFLLRPDPASEASRERNVNLSVEDGTMTPDEVEVREGDRVTLTGGASIRSDTFGIFEGDTGPGGRITITATDVVTIAGPASGLFTDTLSRGPGGDIILHAREVRLSDGATLSATSSARCSTPTTNL